MTQRSAKARNGSRRRDKNKLANYGATLFHEVKRYDGDGNLIETVSPDELMARPIGATRKYKGYWDKQKRSAQLSKTNGEGSNAAWDKVVAAVNRGAKVDYKKEKV
jgi:hypothetical protein